jgi:hypothetical protein
MVTICQTVEIVASSRDTKSRLGRSQVRGNDFLTVYIRRLKTKTRQVAVDPTRYGRCASPVAKNHRKCSRSGEAGELRIGLLHCT